MNKGAAYYADLAHACDAVLKLYPVDEKVLFQVSMHESSLPKLITDLHPDRIWLTSTTVSFDFGDDKNGFWIGWGQDELHTNSWNLVANVQGSRKTVYVEAR